MEILSGVGVEPGGLGMEKAVRLIDGIASRCDPVGPPVAEPMPCLAIRLKNRLDRLSLLK